MSVQSKYRNIIMFRFSNSSFFVFAIRIFPELLPPKLCLLYVLHLIELMQLINPWIEWLEDDLIITFF